MLRCGCESCPTEFDLNSFVYNQHLESRSALVRADTSHPTRKTAAVSATSVTRKRRDLRQNCLHLLPARDRMTLRRIPVYLPERDASTERGRERVVADLYNQATSSMLAEKDHNSARFRAKEGEELATEGHQSSSDGHSSDGERPQRTDPKAIEASRAVAMGTSRGAARRYPRKPRPTLRESGRQDDRARRNIRPPVRIAYIPKQTKTEGDSLYLPRPNSSQRTETQAIENMIMAQDTLRDARRLFARLAMPRKVMAEQVMVKQVMEKEVMARQEGRIEQSPLHAELISAKIEQLRLKKQHGHPEMSLVNPHPPASEEKPPPQSSLQPLEQHDHGLQRRQLQFQQFGKEVHEHGLEIYTKSIEKFARSWGGRVEDIPPEQHEAFERNCMVRATNHVTLLTARRLSQQVRKQKQ